MTKGGANAQSDDWACCEKCAYCFTIFIGIAFFLAGGAMAVLAGLMMWSTVTIDLSWIPIDLTSITLGIFIIGLAIAGTALLGMISAGCARCAANPDGKNDCCEKCCTAILSIVYIIILSVLLAASLVIAGFLSYYAVQLGTGDDSECSDVNFNAASTAPDALTCPIDAAMWSIFNGEASDITEAADGWVEVQDVTFTCGYYCNSTTCDFTPTTVTEFPNQLTGRFCNESIPTNQANEVPITEWTDGRNWANVQGYISNQAFRPTLYDTLNTYLLPFLIVWWCIFVLAILLIVAACAMCIRKSKTKKESTYKPENN